MEPLSELEMRLKDATPSQKRRILKHVKCFCGSGKKYMKCHMARRRTSK